MKNLLSLIILIAIASCASNSGHTADIVIHMDDYSNDRSKNPIEFINSQPHYICLSNESNLSFSFKNIEKTIIKGNLIYILETGNTRILVFDYAGNPIYCIDNRGRGPNEYLRISDFDVDENGNIWIVDAQKNTIYKLSPEFEFVKTIPTQNEITKISCLTNDLFLCQIASWDSSDYSGSQLVVTDSSFVVKEVLSHYPTIKDDNFVFLSYFSPARHSVFYCEPIEDRLYEISNEGFVLNTYDFDFASKKVPEKYKSDIESHYEQINNYCRFIFRSYRISSNFITVGIHDDSWGTAIINKTTNTIAYFDDEASGFCLIGQCAEGSIWKLNESDCTVDLPQYVQDWIRNDFDVIVVLPDE